MKNLEIFSSTELGDFQPDPLFPDSIMPPVWQFACAEEVVSKMNMYRETHSVPGDSKDLVKSGWFGKTKAQQAGIYLVSACMGYDGSWNFPYAFSDRNIESSSDNLVHHSEGPFATSELASTYAYLTKGDGDLIAYFQLLDFLPYKEKMEDGVKNVQTRFGLSHVIEFAEFAGSMRTVLKYALKVPDSETLKRNLKRMRRDPSLIPQLFETVSPISKTALEYTERLILPVYKYFEERLK